MEKFFSSEKAFLVVVGAIAAIISVALQQCSDKCQVKRTYTYYKPVYSTTDEIKAATGIRTAEALHALGKIYWKDNYLFVNEIGKGIHIYDNTNPSTPMALSFLNIPGNYDLAISGTTLYADSFVDLVLFDISDIANIKIINRQEGFFKNYSAMGFQIDAQKGIVTSWEQTSTITLDENDCSPTKLQAWGGI